MTERDARSLARTQTNRVNLILANLFGLSINNLTSAIAQTAAHKYASAAQACASAALYDTPYTDQIAETWGETATKFAQLSATYADLAVTHARKVAEETANAVTDESAPLANRLVPLTAKLADLAEHLAEANASTADSHSTRLAADLDRLRTIERDWISDRNPSTTWFPTADQKEAFTNVSASSSTLAQACIDLASIWGELAEQALVLAESWTEFADKGVSGTG